MSRKINIEADSLKKIYKNREVVKNVSLSMEKGEVVGLLGPNGAGKTTTFYMITGIVKPNYGRVMYNGEDITNFPMYKRARLGLGYLPQEASVFRNLTVEENIVSVLEMRGVPKKERMETMNSLIEEFKLSHVAKSLGYALSGGERRRVEIARTISTNPDFILLDEPTSALDPISAGKIEETLYGLKDQYTMLLVTRSMQQASRISDKTAFFLGGDLIEFNSTKQMFLEPAHKETEDYITGKFG